jgi:hypothetical protein
VDQAYDPHINDALISLLGHDVIRTITKQMDKKITDQPVVG